MTSSYSDKTLAQLKRIETRLSNAIYKASCEAAARPLRHKLRKVRIWIADKEEAASDPRESLDQIAKLGAHSSWPMPSH